MFGVSEWQKKKNVNMWQTELKNDPSDVRDCCSLTDFKFNMKSGLKSSQSRFHHTNHLHEIWLLLMLLYSEYSVSLCVLQAAGKLNMLQQQQLNF